MKAQRIGFAALAVLTSAVAEIRGNTYTVNTSSDNVVAGACDNHAAKCSLRGAILAANAHPGDDIIDISIFEFCGPSGCAIVLQSPLPDISTVMSINGPGSGSWAVKPAASQNIRIFNITVSPQATTPVSISGLTLRDGFVVNNGGGAAINNVSAPFLNVTNCALIQNTSTYSSSGSTQKGAALASSAGTVNITGCSFTANLASLEGGAVYLAAGTMNVTNSTFADNVAAICTSCGSGGAISMNTGTLTVTGCTFTNNFAGERGGAIYNGSGTGTVSNSTFTGNRGDLGGAIGSFGTTNVSNSTFSSNSTSTNDNIVGSGGGAIGIENGTTNITNCTISGNSAENSGGGIYNQGTANVTNSTITGNSVARNNFSPAGGGGVYTAPPGGFFNGGTTHIKNCIVALNSVTGGPGPDLFGTFDSAGFNLIGKRDNSTGLTAATDQTGTIAAPLEPKLDPNGLQNNGGPTQTIALLLGSPAIDTGTSAALTGSLANDQRGSGFSRAIDDLTIPNASGGDGADIGAFEIQTTTATPTPSTLANVSTRLPVQTGDNALFAGFIISGTQDKKVAIVALGPSLSQFFSGVLGDPVLELYSGSTLLESNDNWVDSPNKQAIMDNGVAPPDNLESAIIRTLPANGTGYTAILRGTNNGTGIGVVQAFDLDRSVDSKLANISTRGLVQTGDNLLIAGTIIVGQASQRVLICALGPSLSQFFSGALADPFLELHDGNGATMETNDNWIDSANKQAIIDTGLAPSNNFESAIIRTLPANGAQYTAIVRGLNNTTGVAVVEVFALN
ncbi:MAG: choice-of-anchor Q domain-containing protein [Chthoniobacterales bacterium]